MAVWKLIDMAHDRILLDTRCAWNLPVGIDSQGLDSPLHEVGLLLVKLNYWMFYFLLASKIAIVICM